MKEVIAKLNRLIKEHRHIEGELVQIAEAERQAQVSVDDLVKSGKIDDDEAIKSLAFWNSKLSMMPARRQQIASRLAETDSNLREELKAFVHNFHLAILQRRTEMHADIINKLLPFVSHPSVAEKLAQQCCLVQALGTKASYMGGRVTNDTTDIVSVTEGILGEFEAFCRERK